MSKRIVRNRPSTIDIALFGRDDDRAKLEQLALDPGTTVDALHEAVKALGIKSARSSTARWRLKIGQRQSGPLSAERRRLIAAILSMSDADLRKLQLAMPDGLVVG